MIVIDPREQTPLRFTQLPSAVGTLTSGDYSVRGIEHLFAVERKSIADLVSCCMGANRERFERELHRLRGFRFARLLVIRTTEEIERHGYTSAISPAAVLNSVWAFEARYNVPTVWEPSTTKAATLVERWVHWFAREITKQAEPLMKEENHDE